MKKITFLVFLFATIINAQVANQPNDLVVCDDDNDGVFCFDLTIQNTQVLGSQNPVDYTISYHATQFDADSDSNPLPITYCNTNPVETIFVRLEDNASGGVMFDTTSFSLIVNPLPVVTLPEDTIRCVDTNGLLINPFDIGTDLGPGISYSWSTPTGMSSGPTVTVTVPGTYSVTVTDNNSSTSCGYSDSITITAELQPCPLSVEEVNAINVAVYPNPVKEKLKLQAEANLQIEGVEVYSLSGKKVLQQQVLISESITVDVNTLSSGFYILKIQTKEKGILTKRFIIE